MERFNIYLESETSTQEHEGLVGETEPRRVNRDLHTSHFQGSTRREGAGQRARAGEQEGAQV